MDNPFGSTGTGEKDGSETSGKGGTGGRRGNVHVKGLYGTKTFKPSTGCNRCSTRAVGVWVKEESYSGQRWNVGEPLCGIHRDRVKNANQDRWENTEFRAFVSD